MQVIQNLLCIRRQIYQISTLYRLHDDHGLVVFPADLVAFSALYGGIFIIHIVKLDLYHLDLGILLQNLLQHFRSVVEGDSEMTDLAFLLQFQCGLIGTALFEMCKNILGLGVHQIKVKIFHPAGFQLTLEERPDVLLLVKIRHGQLIRQDIFFSFMSAGKTFLYGKLAFPAQISMGGIKIIEALLQKSIHHLRGLHNIDVCSVLHHGKSHTAEAEILLHFLKIHSLFSLLSTSGFSFSTL